ncbi:phosphoribosyl-ATP pyrophosphatase [Acetobacter ascendens]|uniref:phosphoribosyl-ATP pyrophosphatase n=1 Tax=Acetobacter ascendens TaxID=481146 RepID=UPI000875EC8D|nr:phosphoribosyl-ATP pyrophosphatase [Acetobacter ascendens]AOW48888.1 phosphoribosyl-ATP pyrophosphatase [Acetobacter ascendens]
MQRIIHLMVTSLPPASPPASVALKRLCRQVGLHATNCTAAFIDDRQQDIVHESALFLQTLHKLWESQDVNPAEVWTELLRRLEVAELLMKLYQPPHRKKRNGKVMRPWRVTTSKLP